MPLRLDRATRYNTQSLRPLDIKFRLSIDVLSISPSARLEVLLAEKARRIKKKIQAAHYLQETRGNNHSDTTTRVARRDIIFMRGQDIFISLNNQRFIKDLSENSRDICYY